MTQIKNYRKIFEQNVCNIPKGWDIHHINLNHQDNEIKNLIAIPKKMHTEFHNLSYHVLASLAEYRPYKINYSYNFDFNRYLEIKNIMFFLYKLQHYDRKHISDNMFNYVMFNLTKEWCDGTNE